MLGILCGIEREARMARNLASTAGLDAEILCSGAVASRAVIQAEKLVSRGATRLLSFGVAGGLATNLAPGVLIVPKQVCDSSGQRWTTDKSWRDAMGAGIHDLTVLGAEHAITEPKHKVRLHQTTGASLVDMESHHVARAAEADGLPFLVIRAIADSADMALPGVALASIDDQGRERPIRALAALARHPGDLPALIHLARASGKAFRSLSGVRLV